MKFWFALLLGVLACEPTNNPKSAAGAGSPSRDQVIACYSQEYQKKKGASPSIDDQERAAADDLLHRYAGQPRRACGVVTAALSGELCGMSVSLASVLACERRKGHAQAGVGIDPAAKSKLEQRINENERRQQVPSQFGN